MRGFGDGAGRYFQVRIKDSRLTYLELSLGWTESRRVFRFSSILFVFCACGVLGGGLIGVRYWAGVRFEGKWR